MIKTNKHKVYFYVSTSFLVELHNKILKNNLIPLKNTPVYGNSFTDPNDQIFQQPINKK